VREATLTNTTKTKPSEENIMKTEVGVRRLAIMVGIAVLVMTSVVSCLPFPLSNPADSRIDPKLTGYWRKVEKDPEKVTILLIAPFDKNAYLIHAVGYDKKNPAKKDHMVFKGWLTQLKGQRFLVLASDDQLAGSTGTTADKIYPTYKLESKGEQIIARFVDDGFAPLKKVKTAKQMTKVITDNIDNPAMYPHTERWRRLNPKQNETLIEESMK
jgi:hypothetical protein